MPPEDTKALVTRYVEGVLDRGNPELLGDICSPNYKRYLPPASDPLTLDEQRQRLSAIRAAFPARGLSGNEIVREGNLAAFHAVVQGTRTGPFLGPPATGDSFSVPALDVVRVQDGQFVEHSAGPDLFALSLQVGAMLRLDTRQAYACGSRPLHPASHHSTPQRTPAQRTKLP